MTNNNSTHALELDESNALDKIVLYALEEATEKLEQTGEVEPFTVVLHNENLHFESHPGEDAVECFNAAAVAVKHLAHVMDAYVFVYDGYISTDSGTKDALIAERGMPSSEQAEAFALLYTLDESQEGSLTFEEGIYGLGLATSLLQDEPITSDDLEDLDEPDIPDASDEL